MHDQNSWYEFQHGRDRAGSLLQHQVEILPKFIRNIDISVFVIFKSDHENRMITQEISNSLPPLYLVSHKIRHSYVTSFTENP